jgi:phosphomevalonate kinase
MGESASVPIEPDEQTELLDACCAIPGVIGGGVPGGKWWCVASNMQEADQGFLCGSRRI